jgi:hypothetical protein
MSKSAEQVEYISIERAIPMRRVWAMPDSCTFDIPPIRALVKTYLNQSKVSIDPFARNKRWATFTNDLNPDTAAETHLPATEFLCELVARGVRADLIFFDPPYSPYQIIEHYKGIGRDFSHFAKKGIGWKTERDLMAGLTVAGGHVISCGWNSVGLGVQRGFEIVEILLVSHGREHNDTICTVERKTVNGQCVLWPSLKEELTV